MKEASINKRESGIELLKIIAIFMIVISHVVSSLNKINIGGNVIFNLEKSTTDVNTFILICMRYFGALGNLIFIIASSYFLVDSKKDYKKKIIQLIADVFIISILIMIISLCMGINISKGYILK